MQIRNEKSIKLTINRPELPKNWQESKKKLYFHKKINGQIAICHRRVPNKIVALLPRDPATAVQKNSSQNNIDLIQ